MARLRRVDSDPVQSVGRSLKIIDLLSRSPDGMRIKDLSHNMNLKVTTVHSLLGSLMFHKWVGQRPDGRYEISGGAYQVAARLKVTDHLLSAAHNAIGMLAAKFNETLTIHLIKHSALYSVLVHKGEHPLIVNSDSKHGALHNTAKGKVLLASLDDDVCAQYLQSTELMPHTPNSIIDPVVLAHHIAQVRKQGYAVNHGEDVAEVNGAAVPIYDANNKAIAILGIGYAGSRYTPEYERLMINELVAAGRDISCKIGSTYWGSSIGNHT